MKKRIFILLFFATLQGCKKYCYNCTDMYGSPTGQKCFKTEEEQQTWSEAEKAAHPSIPVTCN